jgi:hypothetical protein
VAALESAEGDGALARVFGCVGLIIIVGKIVWVDADVVGVGVMEKADCFNVIETCEERLADTVHAIHDAAIAGENDRVGEVTVVDEAGVGDDFAAGELFVALIAPIGLVQLANGGERYAFSGKGTGEIDEAVDVPGTEALRRLAEVVLRAHVRFLFSFSTIAALSVFQSVSCTLLRRLPHGDTLYSDGCGAFPSCITLLALDVDRLRDERIRGWKR